MVRLPLLALCALLLLGGCVGSGPQPVADDAAGRLSGSAPLLEGGQLELSSLEGRDVVLWFWAPW